MFALIVRVPAYSPFLPYRNLSSWWGSVASFVNATQFVQDLGIWQQLRQEGVEWLLATWVNGTLINIGMDNRTKSREYIMQAGRRFDIHLGSSAVWVLWLYTPGPPADKHRYVLAVVLGSFGCAVALIAVHFVVLKIIWSCEGGPREPTARLSCSVLHHHPSSASTICGPPCRRAW